MQYNKSILVVENFYPLQTRSLRIEQSLKKYGYNVHSVMWNRNNVAVSPVEGHHVYTKTSRSKFKKLISIFFYYRHLKNIVRGQKYNVLIASHWDMLFLCSLLKGSNHVLIYDNLDMPTHKYDLIRNLFRQVEILALRKTTGILYASRFFKDFYRKDIPSMILENKPLKYVFKGFVDQPIKPKITISFFGTLRYSESLKLLIDVVGKMGNVNLVIKGSGFAEELISYKESKNYSNVILDVGWYNYDDLGKIFSKTDVIWAAYPSKDFNVKYAISNKFFESMLFNKPGIFAANTELGSFVSAKGMGYTVDPYSFNSIESMLNELLKNEGESVKQTKQVLAKFKPKEIFWEDEEEKLISFIESVK